MSNISIINIEITCWNYLLRKLLMLNIYFVIDLHIHNIYSNQLRLCFRYRKQNQ